MEQKAKQIKSIENLFSSYPQYIKIENNVIKWDAESCISDKYNLEEKEDLKWLYQLTKEEEIKFNIKAISDEINECAFMYQFYVVYSVKIQSIVILFPSHDPS